MAHAVSAAGGLKAPDPSGFETRRSAALIPALAIAGTVLAAAALLLFRGNSCGDDLNFHLLSWIEAARGWQIGIGYPHWAHTPNYGAGEPRMVFYPPASWMLGGLLGQLAPWPATPILFVLLALASCGASMYFVARAWVGRCPATLAACAYAANPYALFLVYHRSALAELLAGIWIPPIVLFAVRRNFPVPAFGGAVAAVWLTNAPAAVMACYLLVFLALGMAWTERAVWPLLRAAGGAALGLALAAFYILPAAYEQRWVEIERSMAPGLRIRDSFLFSHTGDAYHDHVLAMASCLVLFETAVIAVTIALAAWQGRRGRAAAPPRFTTSAAKVLPVLMALAPAIFFLQLPASLGVWRLAPWLKFLQFPWRLLLVLSAVGCLLIALVTQTFAGESCASSVRPGRTVRKAVRVGAALVPVSIVSVLVLSIAIGSAFLFFVPCDEEDAVHAQVASFLGDPASAGVQGTDEYTPRGADNSRIQEGLPLVRVFSQVDGGIGSSSPSSPVEWKTTSPQSTAAPVRVERDTPEHWIISMNSQAAGFAVLRLMDYPAWQVMRNGQPVAARPHRKDGLMAVPIDAGANRIEVRWRTTADVIAGRTISVIALVLLVAAAAKRGPRQADHV